MTSQLNSAQGAAVTSDAPLILTLAGPGSGKTRTLVERIRHLLLNGTPPSEIVAITFTNSAARELEVRLANHWLENPPRLGYVGTLHGFLLKLIQRKAAMLGYMHDKIGVLEQEQADEILERCCQELGYRGAKQKVKGALRSACDRSGLPGTRFAPEELVAVRYVKTLRNNAMLSFDLILFEALRLTRKLGYRATEYSHLFVDEYQDSANIDAEIYRELWIPNKFFVGDPDQSIYSFRGGNIDNIMGLAWMKGCEVHTLEENYRSGSAICETANALIRHNPNRIEKDTHCASGVDADVHARQFKSPLAEREYVARWIKQSIEGDQSVAVLVRSNALVEEWSDYLTAVGISVAKRAAASRPADWNLCRTTIALLNNPENDWLAYWFIRAKHGAVRADAERLNALSLSKSLNAHGLSIPGNLPLRSYTQILARAAVSQESISIVETAIAGLPETATAADLLLVLAESENQGTEEGRGVTVTTIHSAKGREWDFVVLPAFEDEVIPGTAKCRNVEEERRLAYVAVTRARTLLLVTHCDERKPPFGFVKPAPAHASRFIAEMGLTTTRP